MKKLRSLTAIVLVIVLLFSFTGCGEVQKAEAAVNGMFKAFMNMELEEAQKYINADEITDETADEMTDEYSQVLLESIFSNLNYEIISSEKIDSNTVMVKTKITATDMLPVLRDYLTKAFEYAITSAFSSPQPSEEETEQVMLDMLKEIVSQSELETVTNEVDLKVVKTESKEWKIESDDAFGNAITGGLLDAVDEMSASLSEY